MKWKKTATVSVLSALILTACGINENEVNDTAIGNRGANEPTRVQYTPGDDTGDFSSTAIYNYNNHVNDVGIRDVNTHRENRTVSENRNRNITNVNYTRNRANNDNRLTIAERAADKIAAMREVDQANVFVTENNAYVAAQLAGNAGDELAADTEKRISDIVKSTDRDIDHVYVSSNPDFYNRTTSYANDIRNGRPVAGFFKEFNTLVQRIFPSER